MSATFHLAMALVTILGHNASVLNYMPFCHLIALLLATELQLQHIGLRYFLKLGYCFTVRIVYCLSRSKLDGVKIHLF